MSNAYAHTFDNKNKYIHRATHMMSTMFSGILVYNSSAGNQQYLYASYSIFLATDHHNAS